MAGAGDAQVSGPPYTIVVDCERGADGVGRDYFFACARTAKLLGGSRRRIFFVDCRRINVGNFASAVCVGAADVCCGWRSFGVARVGGSGVGFPARVRRTAEFLATERKK